MVVLLLANGADVNVRDKYGSTPLFAAAGNGRKDVVELLLAHKADVNAKNNIGWTPLFKVKSIAMAELLLANGADVNAKGTNGVTPLKFAEANSDRDIVEWLRQHGGHVITGTNTTIIEAAEYGELEIVRALLKANPDLVNSKSEGGDTPLHFVASRGWKDVAELLLANKADVNAKDIDGDTPMHFAAAYGTQEMVELLRQHGGH